MKSATKLHKHETVDDEIAMIQKVWDNSFPTDAPLEVIDSIFKDSMTERNTAFHMTKLYILGYIYGVRAERLRIKRRSQNV